MMIGTGVDVTYVERMRDRYIDARVRKQQWEFSKWDARDKALKDIEALFDAETGINISTVLGEFFSAWQDLANDPEDTAVRQNLIEKSDRLCNAIRNAYNDLTQIQRYLDVDVKAKVDEINSIIRQIAQLNQDIAMMGGRANDLMDKRDALVDKLAQYVDAQADMDDMGVYTVRIGGLIVVQGRDYCEIGLTREPTGYKLVYEPNGQIMDIKGGEIKGIYEVRDEVIPDIIDQLNELASTLINEVNTRHRNGYALDGVTTGLDFFSGSDASDIEVNSQIKNDPSLIAASSDGAPGNNENALDIADLQYQPIMSNNTESMQKYYNSIHEQIGLLVEESTSARLNNENFLEILKQHQQEVSGVSIDEEIINLQKYETAYAAAAKIITTADNMMETLLSLV